MPFSISSLGLYSTDSRFPLTRHVPLVFDKSWWHQVCEPIACPAAATCLRIAGSYVACSPIGKKMALVQCAASAASTAWVFFGHGPSSKVSTTSPSRRKSWLLKCSKPKPGPPVVSISTTREMPSASGLPGHEEPRAMAGAGDSGGAAAAGTCVGAGVVATATVAERSTPTVGAFAEVKAGFAAGSSTFCSAVLTTVRAEPSVDAVCVGDVDPIGTDSLSLCESI